MNLRFRAPKVIEKHHLSCGGLGYFFYKIPMNPLERDVGLSRQTGGSIQHSYSAADSFSTDFMETKTIWSRARTPAYVWLVQLFAAYVAYITGQSAV